MKYYEIAVREITEDGDIDPAWVPIAVIVSGSADLGVLEHAAELLVHSTPGKPRA